MGRTLGDQPRSPRARRRLSGGLQRKLFRDRYGHPLPRLRPQQSYKERVLSQTGDARQDSRKAEARRIRIWIKNLKQWANGSRGLTGRQNEKIDSLVDVLEKIRDRPEADESELPLDLGEGHLCAMRDVARVFGAEVELDANGVRRVRIQRVCPPGLQGAISEWVLTHRALGSKSVLRSVRHELETGVRRGYTDKEFDVLKRIGAATREQIIQRGSAMVARRFRISTNAVVFINGKFFGGALSPRDGVTLEWARSRMRTTHWGKIQRHVRDAYPPREIPLGRVLTGSVENFTRWIVRNGAGLLVELPDKHLPHVSTKATQ